MNGPTTSSDSIYSRVEQRACEVPSTKDLTEKGSVWLENLTRRGYVINNRLTEQGKTLYKQSVRKNWVKDNSDGGLVAHSDFALVQSLVDDPTIENPQRLKINLLNRDICLMSAFAERKMLDKKKMGETQQQQLTQLENAHTEFKRAHQKFFHHVHDPERTRRSPTWRYDDKPITLDLAKALDELSYLITVPDHDTCIQEGQNPGQSSTPATEDSDTTFSKLPQTSGTSSVCGPVDPNRQVSVAGRSFYSQSNQDQSAAWHEADSNGSARSLGGLTVPTGTGVFPSTAQYGHAIKGGRQGEEGSVRRLGGTLKRSLQGTIPKMTNP